MDEIIFDKDEDWDARTLCSDESCIGTIGPDGLCRECGKNYEGVLQPKNVANSEHLVAAEEKKLDIAQADSAADDDWDSRVLCGDESCIGVIGRDGKCKECGKPRGH